MRSFRIRDKQDTESDDNVELAKTKDETRFHCSFCLKNFKFEKGSKRHEGACKTKHTGFLCRYCRTKFPTRDSRREHKKVHAGEKKRFNCQFCTKTFHTHFRRIEHENSLHTKEKPHKCTKCEMAFTTKNILRKHQIIHTNPEAVSQLPCKCKFCPMSFRDKSHLSSHVGFHHPEKRPRASNHGNGMEIQLKNSQTITNGIVASHQDRNYFDSPDNEMSAKINESEIPDMIMDVTGDNVEPAKSQGKARFHCSFCSKNFKLKQSFKRHEMKHTGFTCRYCRTKFSTLRSLRDHKKVHAGEKKRYNCQYCTKTFDTHFRRIEHENSRHTKEKPHKCTKCEMAFTTKILLRKHQIVHTNPEVASLLPCKCKFCPMSFKDKSHLTSHVGHHHPEKRPQVSNHGNGMEIQLKTCQTNTNELVASHQERNSIDSPDNEISTAKSASEIPCIEENVRTNVVEPEPCSIDVKLEVNIEKPFPFLCGFCMQGFFHTGPLADHFRANHANSNENESQHLSSQEDGETNKVMTCLNVDNFEEFEKENQVTTNIQTATQNHTSIAENMVKKKEDSQILSANSISHESQQTNLDGKRGKHERLNKCTHCSKTFKLRSAVCFHEKKMHCKIKKPNKVES